jgi:hypothetical protein
MRSAICRVIGTLIATWALGTLACSTRREMAGPNIAIVSYHNDNTPFIFPK